MTVWEMLARLAVGAGLGTAIGFERQYRARMAGLRTNALVATGATLFVLLSAHGFTGPSADPTRVAAQIVSGIGFLGGGVILREGLTVRGLNTAATLWCAAAVGALAGAGVYPTAIAGTVAVIAVNIVLRPLGWAIDRRPETRPETPTRYEFLAVTTDTAEAQVRALLVQALARTEFALQSVASTNITPPSPHAVPDRVPAFATDTHRHDAHSLRDSAGDDCDGCDGHLGHNGPGRHTGFAVPGRVEVRALLSAEHRDDKQLEAAISRLSLEPSVTSVRWRTVGSEHDEHGDPAGTPSPITKASTSIPGSWIRPRR